MRRKVWFATLVCVLALSSALHAQSLQGILSAVGVLPFDTLDLESFHAKVVFEPLAGVWSHVAQVFGGETEFYGKLVDGPGTQYQMVMLVDGEPMPLPQVQRTTALPTPAPELFFRNYEIHITDYVSIAGRPCHMVESVARADQRLAVKACVDAETGYALSVERYDMQGNRLFRETTTYFEPNPDLSDVDFGEPASMALESWDISLKELQALVPWLQSPGYLPEGFELIGILQTGLPASSGSVVSLYYSDGLAGVAVTLPLLEHPVQASGPELFEETRADTTMVMLSYKGNGQPGPSISLMGASVDVDPATVARMLWSMLPGGDADDVR